MSIWKNVCIDSKTFRLQRPKFDNNSRWGPPPAIRWLGIWFDGKLTLRRHVAMRVAKAAKVANHIRGLERTIWGPPASSRRKAAIVCAYPSLLHGTEFWYRCHTRPPRILKPGRPPEVSAYVGWHMVDSSNLMKRCDSTQQAENRTWRPLLYFLLDVSIHNVWRLCASASDESHTQFSFKKFSSSIID